MAVDTPKKIRLFGSKRRISRRSLVVLGGFLALTLVVLDSSDVRMVRDGRIAMMELLAPVTQTLQKPVILIQNMLRNVDELANLRTENQALRQKLSQFEQKQHLIGELKSENQALRQQLNFIPEEAFGFITAPVVADSAGTFVRSLIVKAGETHGVRKGQAVMTGEGLIGRIEHVGSNTARVVLIEDLNSRIPVMLQKDRTRSILAGRNTRLPSLLYLPETASPSQGDVVVTSGDGGAFPTGLPVGTVSTPDGVSVISVRPYADLQRLDFVKIVDYGLTGILMEGTN